ncbi:MAG: C25 family cysteine peptidase [bacterium]|nr:C25 family cysteine peptidase [bacterium]
MYDGFRFIGMDEVINRRREEKERIKFLFRSFKGRYAMRKCASIKVGMMAMALILAIPAFGGEIIQELRFSPADLEFSKLKEYDVVKLGLNSATSRLGEPALPLINLHVLIPPGASVEKVEIIDKEKVSIPGNYNIIPAQHPVKLSINDELPPWVEPVPGIYSSMQEYPGEVLQYIHTGTMSGYRIAGMLVYPLQYIPQQKKLFLYTKIKVRVTYKEGACPVTAKSGRQNKVFGDIVKGLVANPTDMARFMPPSSKAVTDTQYVIITDTIKVGSYFKTLVNWKRARGISATLVNVDRIYAQFPGGSYKERIRNFIKYANSEWGTSWVLLGGGENVLPRVYGWFPDTYPDGTPVFQDWEMPPTDLYFADLDGNWDANGNGQYGEMYYDDAHNFQNIDSLDLYPDIFLGRASVNNAKDCTTFVNKVLTYEDPTKRPTDYQKKMLLIGEYLFGIKWGGMIGDSIASVTPLDYTITKLYEEMGTLNRQTVFNSLNSGYHLLFWAAHGNNDVIGAGQHPNRELFYSEDADALTNGDRYPVCVAISCFIGSYDWGECIVEHFMNNRNGGSVAWVANTRYGYGNITKKIGYSGLLCINFFDALFNHNGYSTGIALNRARPLSVPMAFVNPISRYSLYSLNIFGDPESPIFFDATPPPQDDTPPIISNLQVIPEDHQATITWTTDELASSWVEYGLTPNYGDNYIQWEYVTEHQIILSDLGAATTYYYRIKSADLNGNYNVLEGSFVTLEDITPPTFSSVFAFDVISPLASIYWETNEPSNSQVIYGTTPTCENNTPVDEELVKRHFITIEGLVPFQLYYYCVISTDEYGNCDTSNTYTFTTYSQAHALNTLWTEEMILNYLGSAVRGACLANTYGDEKMEIIVAHWYTTSSCGGPGVYSCDGDLLSGFHSYSGYAFPIVADIDNDDLFEIIHVIRQFGVTSKFVVEVLNMDGIKVWATSLPCIPNSPYRVVSSPALVDVNDDGNLDVLIGGSDGQLWALNSINGNTIWTFEMGGEIVVSPVVSDIDRDGELDIIVGNGTSWGGLTTLCVLNKNGAKKWEYSFQGIPYSNGIVATPGVADITGDQRLEIIQPIDGWGIVVFDCEGNIIRQNLFTSLAYSSPAIGDIDRDGSLDIIVGLGSMLYAFTDNGETELTEKWAIGTHPDWDVTSSPALADFNNDGYLEIVFGASTSSRFWESSLSPEGKIYILDHNGTILACKETIGGMVEGSNPTIADINRDGKLEIVVGTVISRAFTDALEVFQIPDFNCATISQVEWPMFHHDIWHTGRYGFNPYNRPPNEPVCVYPRDKSSRVWLIPIIKWSCEDPDGDLLTYKLYLDTFNPPTTLKYTGSDTFYTPETPLNYSTTYYWQVIATDRSGASTESPVWSFTTWTGKEECHEFYTTVCDSYDVTICSNSYIEAKTQDTLDFDRRSRKLSFKVIGLEQSGYCAVTIPWGLLHDTLKISGKHTFMVTVDGVPIAEDALEIEQKADTFINQQGDTFTCGGFSQLSFRYDHSGWRTIEILAPIQICDIGGGGGQYEGEDGKINILDLVKVTSVYALTPDAPNWNPKTDFNKNKKIDILDVVLLCTGYGMGGKKANLLSILKKTLQRNEVVTVSVVPTMSAILPGDTFNIDIDISNVNRLKGYDFKLKYNPNVLKAIKIIPGLFLGDDTYTIKNELYDEGWVWFAIASLGQNPGASGDGTLATITFVVKGTGESILDLYEVELADYNANLIPHETIDGEFNNSPIAIEDAASINSVPQMLALKEPYPNPFSSNTVIRYGIPKTGMVSLKVYNIAGEIVATLVNEEKLPGYYSVNLSSKELADGIYFLKLRTQEKVITKKTIVLQ